MRSLQALGLAATALWPGSLLALDCAPVVDLVAEPPRYEVRLIEITPLRPASLAWPGLRTPGLKALPPAGVESEPQAYSTELYAAAMPESELSLLGEQLALLGQVEAQRPVALSAPWGMPTGYRQRATKAYIQQRKDAAAYTELVVGREDSWLRVEVTGVRAEPPRVLVRLEWQQTVGWSKTEPREAGAKRDPVRATLRTSYCAELAEGDALLMGGLQRLAQRLDRASEQYGETAVIVSLR